MLRRNMLASVIGGLGWVTTASLTPNSSSGDWTNYTMRTLLPAAALSAGTKVRLTLKAPAANSVVISGATFQKQAASGDPYDFSTTPITVLFSGSAGTTIAANGTAITDDIAISLASGDKCILAIHFTTAASIAITNSATGWATYYKSGNHITVVNDSLYTSLAANTAGCVILVEVFS